MDKILHVVPAAPFGGAQKLAIDLAARQRAAGMNATMLLLGEPGQAAKACEVAGVPYTLTGQGLSRVLRARKIMRQADILHLQMPPPWLGPVLPARAIKVLHLHVRPSSLVHPPGLRRTIEQWGARAILRRTDHAIAITGWIADAWRGQFLEVMPPVSIVHNGIELALAGKRPDGAFTLAIASRLSALKGVEEFIALAAELHRRDPAMRFRIAGDGPDRAQYEAMAARDRLSDALTFEGFVEDMAGFWAKAHLTAFTPPFEPFGLRLIEPVGHGVPAVAYRTNSGSDEVINLCRGIAAAPYGDVPALADLVLQLRDDRERLDRMASEGRADIAQHFSLEKMTAEVSEVYSLARQKGRKA